MIVLLSTWPSRQILYKHSYHTENRALLFNGPQKSLYTKVHHLFIIFFSKNITEQYFEKNKVQKFSRLGWKFCLLNRSPPLPHFPLSASSPYSLPLPLPLPSPPLPFFYFLHEGLGMWGNLFNLFYFFGWGAGIVKASHLTWILISSPVKGGNKIHPEQTCCDGQ